MNDYIVWDKLSTRFGFGKVLQVKLNGNLYVEFKDENGKEFYKYRTQKDLEFLNYIGLDDIGSQKIYTDCSICKVNYFSSSDWISDYCYFSFDTENLRYTVCLINEKEIVDFEASYFDCFEIIDTIQENKLGLIKEQI